MILQAAWILLFDQQRDIGSNIASKMCRKSLWWSYNTKFDEIAAAFRIRGILSEFWAGIGRCQLDDVRTEVNLLT